MDNQNPHANRQTDTGMHMDRQADRQSNLKQTDEVTDAHIQTRAQTDIRADK